MSRFLTRTSTASASLAVALAASGCGRFGFEEPRPDGSTRPVSAGDSSTSLRDADSATDASTPDGAGDGASPDAAPLPELTGLPDDIVCSSFTGLIACDNFGGSASGVVVSTGTSGASASASADDIFRGSTGSEMESAHVFAGFNAVTSGALFLRFSAFVPSGFPIRGINLASIGDLSGAPDFGLDLNLVNDGQLELKGSGDGSVTSSGSYRLPRDRWLCVLWTVARIDDTTGVARVFIDGAKIMDAIDIDTLPASGTTGASAGIDGTFSSQGPAAVYIDNFVLTREQPAACP